jgi:hypothetical protein
MASDFFHGIMRWNVERNGTVRRLPYFYHDCLSFAVVLTAATAGVRRLVPHPHLHPVEVMPGRCLVAFSAFEYRQTDDEPYNEASVSLLTTYGARPQPPLLPLVRMLRARTIPSYVWQLPVTGEQTRAGGVDLFGYPKFLADIEISTGPRSVACSLSVGGTRLLRMEGPILATRPGRPLRYLTYAAEGDSLVAAGVLVNPKEIAESWVRSSASLALGAGHPVCDALHAIALGRTPLLYRYIPRCEAILFPARNIRDF